MLPLQWSELLFVQKLTVGIKRIKATDLDAAKQRNTRAVCNIVTRQKKKRSDMTANGVGCFYVQRLTNVRLQCENGDRRSEQKNKISSFDAVFLTYNLLFLKYIN